MNKKKGAVKHSVLFINRVYLPDEASTGQVLAELTKELVRQGWQVTVVCSQTVVDSPLVEVMDGVTVKRVRGVAFSRASHIRRALSYLSLYPTLLWRAVREKKHDVVVTMTDPPLQLLLGLTVRWLRGSCLLHWAQDIYPELAEKLGVIQTNGLLANILRWLSTTVLQRYDRVIVIGRCMEACFIQRGIAKEKINRINNWADVDLIYPVDRIDNTFLREHGIPSDKKLVVYSGNMGMAHPFSAIVQTMVALEKSMPEVLFLFIGEGRRKAWLQDQVAQNQLKNVCFFPYQPKEQLAHSLSVADIHLVCMQDNLCGLVVPSKAYGIMAASRPLFYIGPEKSEIALQIKEAQCGQTFAESDAEGLIKSIQMWFNHPSQQDDIGWRGRDIVTHYSVTQAAKAFDKTFIKVMQQQ